MTATAAELRDAVMSALTDNGRIEKINDEIRQELFNALTEDYHPPVQNELAQENFLINELIREYLQFNGYTNVLSVFLRETNQPEEPMDRNFLAQSINVEPHRYIPILYNMTNIGDYDDSNEKIISSSHSVPTNNPQKSSNTRPRLEMDNDDSSDGFFEITST